MKGMFAHVEVRRQDIFLGSEYIQGLLFSRLCNLIQEMAFMD